MQNLSNKTAVITGAGSGIGRALAINLAKRNCAVILLDKNEKGLNEVTQTLKALGATYSAFQLDVSDCAAVETIASNVGETYGHINYLFNNAGVTLLDSISGISYRDFEWVMNINFWGVVYCTKSFLPHMAGSEDAHIVNLSSAFGLVSTPGNAAYCSSKFAVRGFTESLKQELAGTNISVSCVHPGLIKTAIMQNSRVNENGLGVSREKVVSDFDNGKGIDADEASLQILSGMAAGKRRILVGKDVKLLDLISRIFPSSYERIVGFEKETKLKNSQRRS